MLRVKWANSEEDSKAVGLAEAAGEPKIPGLCDLAWIEGTIKVGENAQEVAREQHEQDAAWKAWNRLPWGDRGRAVAPPTPRLALKCEAAPKPGMRFCEKHGHSYAEPDLKRQAKAREALRKLTKGMTRTVEADGTEVYE